MGVQGSGSGRNPRAGAGRAQRHCAATTTTGLVDPLLYPLPIYIVLRELTCRQRREERGKGIHARTPPKSLRVSHGEGDIVCLLL